jgi:hypothetical protein
MTLPFHNVLPPGSDTLLTISSLGGFTYQARGLTQTLDIIKQAQHQVRTVNGTLIDVSAPQFRKYSSRISATDVNAPPIDGIFSGMAVTVHCAAELSYPVGGTANRPEVSGSSYTEGHMTFYRPILEMLVISVNESFDEWKKAYAWNIDLEEV